VEKKKSLAIVFAVMMGVGMVLQVTVFTPILDSPIGIYIAQIGGLGLAIIIFPILLRNFFGH